MNFLSTVAGVALIAIAATAASASPTPVLVTTHDFANVTDFTATETSGFQFTANSVFNIKQLGVFDSGQDGLAQSHQVGLWDAHGNLLASSVVKSGLRSPLVGLYRYATITAFRVTAGATYFVGAFTGNYSDNFYCCSLPDGLDPRISIVQWGISNSPTFAVPDFIVPSWQYANFTVAAAGKLAAGKSVAGATVSAVPEPATWAIMLTGMGLAGAALRRRRSVAAA